MSDLEDGSFDWEGIDYAAVEAQAKSAPPGPSRQLHKQPTFTQHTLHGKPLAPPPNARAGPSKPPPPARAPPEPRQPETIVSKLWDRSTFQRTGWGGLAEGKGKAKGKAKAKVLDPDDEFYDSYTVEEDIDLSKLYDDPDLNPDKPPPPMKLVYDAQEAKTFLYPLNKPRRDYQARRFPLI